MGPPVPETIVRGTRARYSCRDVFEVDRHLYRLAVGRHRALPYVVSQVRRDLIRRQFLADLDLLLDARLMLTALLDLDDELADLAEVDAERPELLEQPGPPEPPARTSTPSRHGVTDPTPTA